MPFCCPTDVTEIQQQIADLQAAIAAARAARLAIITGTTAQYSLSTGQTQQSVTKLNPATLQTQILSMENELQLLQNKLCGGASFYGRARF